MLMGSDLQFRSAVRDHAFTVHDASRTQRAEAPASRPAATPPKRTAFRLRAGLRRLANA